MPQYLCENCTSHNTHTLSFQVIVQGNMTAFRKKTDLNLSQFRLSFEPSSSSCEHLKAAVLTVGGKSLPLNVTVPPLSLCWLITHGCCMSVHPLMVKGLACSPGTLNELHFKTQFVLEHADNVPYQPNTSLHHGWVQGWVFLSTYHCG